MSLLAGREINLKENSRGAPVLVVSLCHCGAEHKRWGHFPA
jgi:hypothetical protein